jgi:hypothetical protein
VIACVAALLCFALLLLLKGWLVSVRWVCVCAVVRGMEKQKQKRGENG